MSNAAATSLIAQHISSAWADYTADECRIEPVTSADQLPYGAEAAGAQIGDWLIATKDGACAEVVRINGDKVEEVFFKA